MIHTVFEAEEDVSEVEPRCVLAERLLSWNLKHFAPLHELKHYTRKKEIDIN